MEATTYTVVLVSGEGRGAGKSTLAQAFPGRVLSFAGAIRYDLLSKYPDIDWFSKSQVVKDLTFLPDGRSVRQALIDHGEALRESNGANYWAKVLLERILEYGPGNYVVDDLRRVSELDYFRRVFPNLKHFHVTHATAVPEPLYDNQALADRADYLVQRRAHNPFHTSGNSVFGTFGMGT